jgi:anthranilate synthase component 1
VHVDAVPVDRALQPRHAHRQRRRGELAPGRDAFDLFAAAFPAGTLVGAPKVRAMEIIDELEPVRRGLYGGTVGYFGHGGDMDQAIAIRTLVFARRHLQLPGRRRRRGRQRAARPSTREVFAKSAALRRALASREGL